MFAGSSSSARSIEIFGTSVRFLRAAASSAGTASSRAITSAMRSGSGAKLRFTTR